MNQLIKLKPLILASLLQRHIMMLRSMRLTLFRIGLQMGWGQQKDSSLKFCHKYPSMMKLGTVVPSRKDIQKIYESGETLLEFADISIFLLKIKKFCYIKQYRHRLHFDIQFLIYLTFQSLQINMITIFAISAKMATRDHLKRKVF